MHTIWEEIKRVFGQAIGKLLLIITTIILFTIIASCSR